MSTDLLETSMTPYLLYEIADDVTDLHTFAILLVSVLPQTTIYTSIYSDTGPYF